MDNQDVINININQNSDSSETENSENYQKDFININFENTKKKKKTLDYKDLEGFTEIKSKYVKHFHGAWLKFLNKKTNQIHQGGFLDKISNGIVYLRCPSKENVTIYLNENVFYIKNINENYISLLELLKEQDKRLYEESIKYKQLLDYKNNITNLINSGKLQFKKK